jgi:hypothetical protein
MALPCRPLAEFVARDYKNVAANVSTEHLAERWIASASPNKKQSAILLILLTLEESKAIGRNPICHTRESGYPVGHDEAAQDGPTSPVKSG